MLFFRSLHHLVFTVVAVTAEMTNVRDVHYVLLVITKESQGAVKGIKKNVCAKVSDMRVVVDCRAASIKADKSVCNRLEFLYFASHCIV